MIRSFKLKNKNFSPKLSLCNFNNNSDNSIFKYGIKIYTDPLNQRNLIREDNNGKVGIYS